MREVEGTQWPRQYNWHTSPLLSCMFNFVEPCSPLPSLLPCGLRPMSPAKNIRKGEGQTSRAQAGALDNL